MKKIALVAVLGMSIALISCGNTIPEDVSRNQPISSVLHNDLAGGVLEQSFELGDSECFDLGVEYTTDYISSGWRITDSKTIRMRAMMVNIQSGCSSEVLVEHVHADASIKSSREGIDGLKQDSMDDSVHNGDQAGFSINPPYFYENIFAVEGFSETLISGWSFYFSGYGAGGLDEKRLTESNLVNEGGACATKFQVVYDLLIRNAGEEYYHTRSIVSEFLVPVPGASCAALTIAEGEETPTPEE